MSTPAPQTDSIVIDPMEDSGGINFNNSMLTGNESVSITPGDGKHPVSLMNGKLFSVVSSSFPLLLIRVDHKNAVSGSTEAEESRHTSDPISSYFVLANSGCGQAKDRCFFRCGELALSLPKLRQLLLYFTRLGLNYGGPYVTSENQTFGESDFILQPIRMHNFIISNQSRCFIPAATTTIPNV